MGEGEPPATGQEPQHVPEVEAPLWLGALTAVLPNGQRAKPASFTAWCANGMVTMRIATTSAERR
jgi:hypothetical protein